MAEENLDDKILAQMDAIKSEVRLSQCINSLDLCA
jgi:hypothetical protein